MLEDTDYVTQLMVAQRLTVKQSVILSWGAFRVHGARPPREIFDRYSTL